MTTKHMCDEDCAAAAARFDFAQLVERRACCHGHYEPHAVPVSMYIVEHCPGGTEHPANPPPSYYQTVAAWDDATGPGDTNRLRQIVAREEWAEFDEAVDNVYADDTAATRQALAKEAADLIWTVLGMCNRWGIPFDAVWRTVADSNWSKIKPDGTVDRRADGKIIKPDGYRPPDLAALFEREPANEPT